MMESNMTTEATEQHSTRTLADVDNIMSYNSKGLSISSSRKGYELQSEERTALSENMPPKYLPVKSQYRPAHHMAQEAYSSYNKSPVAGNGPLSAENGSASAENGPKSVENEQSSIENGPPSLAMKTVQSPPTYTEDYLEIMRYHEARERRCQKMAEVARYWECANRALREEKQELIEQIEDLKKRLRNPGWEQCPEVVAPEANTSLTNAALTPRSCALPTIRAKRRS